MHKLTAFITLFFTTTVASPAFAQQAGGGDVMAQFFPLILIFALFWFLLIRPQQKKIKAHKAMVEAIRRGDKVVTSGGIVGTVSKVMEDELLIEVAKGTDITVVRSTISTVTSKSTPVNDDKKPSKAKAKTKKGKAA